MKRIKRSVTQRAWKYEEMFPTFVSIVKTGANRIPFASLKMSDDGEYGEGYEIQRIIFDDSFNEESATAYLSDKGIVDYSLQKLADGKLFVENSNSFTDVKTISLGNIEVLVGKTDLAAKQVKTHIVSGNPVMKLEDKTEASTEATETADIILEDTEVSTEEVPADKKVGVDVDPTENEVPANADEDLTLSDPTDTNTTEVDVNAVEDTTTPHIIVELSDNEYIDALKDSNAYIVVDTFLYKFKYKLIDILEVKENVSEKIQTEAGKFAEAVIAHFSAIEAIPETETETVAMSDTEVVTDDSESTTKVTIESLVQKLSDMEEKLTSALEKSTSDIDNTVVMLQTSKADVTAFDQGQAPEVKPQVKQVTTNTKNLFGL